MAYTYGLIEDYPKIAFKDPRSVQRDANGYITEVYFGGISLAEKISEMVEMQFEYAFDTRFGNFTPRLNYTRVLDEYLRAAADSEIVHRVGTINGSNKYRLTGWLNWLANRFAADLFVHYIPGYVNDSPGYCEFLEGSCSYENGLRLPTLQVDSLTTIDLTVTYRFDGGRRLRAGGRNIFEAESPTIWGKLAYDPQRGDARGRAWPSPVHRTELGDVSRPIKNGSPQAGRSAH